MTGAGTSDAEAAIALQRAGRLKEAEAAYERLLARRPDLPDCWFNLAYLQRRDGRYEAALASYANAIKHGVSHPEEVHLNRGVIYADHLRNDTAAEAELRAALAIDPSYTPALLNLANLEEDRGRRAEALALYERIGLDTIPIALARYANLKAGPQADEELIARLRTGIANPRLSVGERAELGFSLGKVLDAAARYSEAFEVYAQANRASADSAPARRPVYDRARVERLVDDLISVFSAERAVELRSRTPSGNPPIFICGMFRSGSTLTEQVLASHRRVTSGGELNLVPAIARSLAPYPASVRELTSDKLGALADKYLADIARLFPNADRLTDKRPDNFLHIGLIKSLFPSAKIVHTTRDPLDNCLSIYFLHLDHGMSYALDLLDTGHYYKQYRRLMAHWRSLYGSDILDFDYDAFVRNARPATERLLDFCGLDWDENCMSFERAENVVKTASVWQVREPLYQRSSGRARNYEQEIAPLRAYLSDL